MKQLIVRGHGLVAEGAAFNEWTPGSRTWHRVAWQGVGGQGSGLCSCGAASDVLPSAAARKAWHRKHKADIYYGEETP